MLGRGHQRARPQHVAALEAAHLGDGHARAEVRILARAFDDAAPARIARDVDHGREGPVQSRRRWPLRPRRARRAPRARAPRWRPWRAAPGRWCGSRAPRPWRTAAGCRAAIPRPPPSAGGRAARRPPRADRSPRSRRAPDRARRRRGANSAPCCGRRRAAPAGRAFRPASSSSVGLQDGMLSARRHGRRKTKRRQRDRPPLRGARNPTSANLRLCCCPNLPESVTNHEEHRLASRDPRRGPLAVAVPRAAAALAADIVQSRGLRGAAAGRHARSAAA